MRKHRWILLATAALIGFLGHVWIFWPPMPMWGWWAHALVGRHAEDWWYSLSEPRDPALYELATGIAGLVFPTLVALFFLAWVRPLWRESARAFPLRWIPLVVFAALNAVYVFMSWGYGMKYQGLTYLLVYIGVNVAALSPSPSDASVAAPRGEKASYGMRPQRHGYSFSPFRGSAS